DDAGEGGTILMHMGARADDTHMSYQDVQKLGDLIQVGFPEEAAHSGNPRVVVERLFCIGLIVHVHRTEFQAGERTAQKTDTALYKEHRTPGIELYEDIEKGEEPTEDKKQYNHGHDDIKNPFGKKIALPADDVLS